MWSRWLQVLVASAVGGAAAIAGVAIADAFASEDAFDDGMARYIPYRGTMSRDGAAYDGTVDMTFRIYDGATASTAAWTETQAVAVSDGRFDVLLGSSSAASVASLAEAVGNADDLYLSVSLSAGGEEILLSGQQRLLPMPFAVKAATARALVVTGTALIEGDGQSSARIVIRSSDGQQMDVDENSFDTQNGPLTVRAGEAVTLDAHLVASGNIDLADRLSTPAGDLSTGADDSLSFDPSAAASNGFRITGTTTFGTGTSDAVSVGGDVSVGSAFSIATGSASATFNGAAQVTGAITTDTVTAGGLSVSGTLKLGYDVKHCFGNNNQATSCTCPTAGTVAIGGGAECGSGSLIMSHVLSDGSGWWAKCGTRIDDLYVICARIGN